MELTALWTPELAAAASERRDALAWIAIALLVGGAYTLAMLAFAARPTRYHYQPGRTVPTAPTKRAAADCAPSNPCTCGQCCCCDPALPAGVEVPPIATAFGSGLTQLPVSSEISDSVESVDAANSLPGGDVLGIPDVASDDKLNKMAAQLAEHGTALPDWIIPEHCGACGRQHDAICFLCPSCQLLTPRHRVHLVFELLEDDLPGEAWAMAEAIIQDVRKYRAAVVNDGHRSAYSHN